MRCEQCGQPMTNAAMWRLGGDREAPTARSMQSLCWECRTNAERTAAAADAARRGAESKSANGTDEAPSAFNLVA